MEITHTAHVPAGEGPHPTVVALHGWGATAHDLLGLGRILHDGEALVLCPQGPVQVPLGPEGASGYGWFQFAEGRPPDPVDFLVAHNLLRGFIDEAVARYPVDRERLILLGFSQGGVMAYDLALETPERFRALVALSSWLPDEIAGRAERSPALEKLPALIIHGEDDPMIPIERAHASREHLEALGLQVAHGEYPMGHELGQQAMRDLYGWLEQVAFA